MSNTTLPDQRSICVDGAYFAAADGEWRCVGYVTPITPGGGSPPFPAPLGCVSVDGALTRVDVQP
jgi:hypothetical protein